MCKASNHVHYNCPKRPCYNCKKTGHLSAQCPYRMLPGAHESTLKSMLSKRKKRNQLFHFLREWPLDSLHNRISPIEVDIPNKQFNCKVRAELRKLDDARLTAAEWHPNGEIFCVGSKHGIFGIWRLSEEWKANELGRKNAHWCNVNAISFDTRSPDCVYTNSSDGSVAMHRIEDASRNFSTHASRRAPSPEKVILDLREGRSDRSSGMAYGMSFNSELGCLYVGSSEGSFWSVDPRDPSNFNSVRIHRDKITCIDVNPRSGNLIATASNDRHVRLWDARRLVPNHYVGTFQHGGVASSAYFSPSTGARLLTTSQNNRIQVWKDINGFLGNVNEKEHEQPIEIVHSHNFHRYLNPFRAEWDPKDWRDDLFMCGRFLGDAYHEEDDDTRTTAMHYPIDLFSVKEGTAICSLIGSATTLRCTTNKFNPVRDIILSTASTNVFLWGRKEEKDLNPRGRYPADRGGPRNTSDGGDDQDDDDGDDRPQKRRRTLYLTTLRSERAKAKERSTGTG